MPPRHRRPPEDAGRSARRGARLRRAALLCAAVFATMITAVPVRGQIHLPRGIDGWRATGLPAVRGVTIGPIESSQQAGRGYGTAYSEALLDHLEAMDVNWVSITPFGRIATLSDTQIQMDFELPYEDNRVAIKAMVRQAHAHGMRVMLVPHLWVEAGGWRGEIDPGSADAWREYQESYRRFVTSWAADAAEVSADAFSIGVECTSWSGRFVPFWKRLIEEVRARFPGVLTYSANWDEAQDVLFWDQLDFISINAFYPLSDHPAATDDEYASAAEAIMDEVHELARVLDMPVLFVELGYTTRRDAAVQPWLWPDDMMDVVVDEREQARALWAMLGAFLPQEWFSGFFLWRYYTNLDDVSQEAIWGFSPHAKEAERMLAGVFHARWAADPGPWPWLRPTPSTPPMNPAGGITRLDPVPGGARITLAGH